jgi:protein-S-isoprenylcysteine O-methyltransferase Ste14
MNDQSWHASEVKEVTLKVAETHRTEKIVTRGVYSIVRHPQYLGGY